DQIPLLGAVGFDQRPGGVFRRHGLERTGHLHLVMANAVAGLAWKHAALETMDQGIQLPVFREQHPVGISQQLLVSKELLRLEYCGVRKAQGTEDIKGNQVHGVSGTPDRLCAFYTESGSGQATSGKIIDRRHGQSEYE